MATFTGLNATFRPLTSWPTGHQRTPDHKRERSRFDSAWSTTLDDLARELRMLKAKDIVLQLDVSESQIRLDGYPRSDARPKSPGAVLSFRAEGMDLMYPCDTYVDWQDNIRAIALSLNALRAVNRYGVSKHGEQYRGWRALPGAGESTVTMGIQEAAGILALHSAIPAAQIVADPSEAKRAARRAAKETHPDSRTGNGRDWQRVQQAIERLNKHYGN